MSNWPDLKDNPRLRENYSQRLNILRLVREFFWSKGFVEVETPVAVKLPGQEPYLNPMAIKIHDPSGLEESFYLRTSPEFALKKLLAAGWNKVFEIGKCFRDFEQFGGRHNTEFTMIEWYRAPGSLEDIMDDTEEFFKFVAKKIGKTEIVYQGKKINILEKWERISMKELWQKKLGVNLSDYLDEEKIKKLATDRGCKVEVDEPYEDVFYKIFLNEIESGLGADKPVIIYDYPARMCSLSKLSADPRYGERFELYIGGLELANAFGELTDAETQKERLEADKQHRNKMGKEIWPVDPDFISALRAGMPEAGGIALGLDRMVLLFTEAKDINEVIFQSISDQLEL